MSKYINHCIKVLLAIFIIFLPRKDFGQNNDFNKLTIITHDYSNGSSQIDTIIRYKADPKPILEILDWEYIAPIRMPILYSKFDPNKEIIKDSVIYFTFRGKKIKKEYSYNDITKEWFLHIMTEKIRSRKVIQYLTFYHEYHKMYFTTKTIFKFNKKGLLISQKTYDLYLKVVESKSTYTYE